MKTYSWLIRREFWEFRATWLIPAVVGAVLIFAALFGRVDLSAFDEHLAQMNMGTIYLVGMAVLFYLVMSVYASWYLMDCLYNDRRDRSILFWKSLPIADSTTVLSKLLVGMVIIPLVYFAAADATALIAAFILSIRARASIGSSLWNGEVWLQVQVLWMYVIFTTALWYLPIAGWLMLVSAWAKRAVMLWVVLPPLLVCILERVIFGTQMATHVIMRRLTGLPSVSFNGGSKHMWTHDGGVVDNAGASSMTVWRLINPSGFFTSAETWIGIAVGVVLIIAAIQLRMRRSEI